MDSSTGDQPDDSAQTLLDAASGTPAVAVGTARETAERKPACIRDSAEADVSAVQAHEHD
jgi:hypothetical protein